MATSSRQIRTAGKPNLFLTLNLLADEAGAFRRRWGGFLTVPAVAMWPFLIWGVTRVMLGAGLPARPWLLALLILIVGWGRLARRFVKSERVRWTQRGLPVPTWHGSEWAGLFLAGRSARWKGFTVRQQWEAGCKALGLTYRTRASEGAYEIVPRLQHLEVTPEGDVSARITPGVMFMDVQQFADQGARFAAAVKAKELVIKREGSGAARLTWLWTLPMERTLIINDLPCGPAGRDTVGIVESGAPFHLDRFKSVLVSGVQGSGKTECAKDLVADWIRRGEYVDLYVANPKVMQHWGWLLRLKTISNCTVRVVEYATPRDGASWATDLVEKAAVRMRERADLLDVDLEDWSKLPADQLLPSKDLPRIVLLLDELASMPELLASTAKKQSPLIPFIRMGRSLMCQAIGITQDGTKNALGEVRDTFGQRVALRQASPSQTAMTLTTDAEARGAKCSEIPEDMPGIGYCYDAEDGTFVKFRLAYVPEKVIVEHLQYGRVPPGMADPGVARPKLEDCAVYRIYGFPGPTGGRTLLYVGKGLVPEDRIEWHLAHQPWRAEIDPAAVRWEWHDSEQVALREEEKLIRKLRPKYNKQLNGQKTGTFTKAWSSRPTFQPSAAVSAQDVVEGEVVPEVQLRPRQRRRLRRRPAAELPAAPVSPNVEAWSPDPYPYVAQVDDEVLR